MVAGSGQLVATAASPNAVPEPDIPLTAPKRRLDNYAAEGRPVCTVRCFRADLRTKMATL